VPKPGGWAPNRRFAEIVGDKVAAGTDKLVVAFSSFAGANLDPDVVRPLAKAGVPFLEGTETAMLALRHLRAHREFLARDPRPTRPAPEFRDDLVPPTHGVLDTIRAMPLLQHYQIPFVETVFASTPDAAVAVADRLGYPVALKVESPDVVHKTDVGGVRLDCADAAAVRTAFAEIVASVRCHVPSASISGVLVQRMIRGGTEMIVGVKTDPLVGPAVVVGCGGVFVEVMRDVSVRVPPLDVEDATAMIDELRGAALLDGVRGRPPADVPALAELLVRVGALAQAYRNRLRAIDLNPVVVLEAGRGVMALDWLIELA
jgi:acetyltransferase